jgi:phage terminase Nu1 subunit (DNA packaging protein)
MNELVNQRTLADVLNLTTRRVQQLEDRGVIIRQPDGGYDVERNRDRYWLFRDHKMDRVVLELEGSGRLSGAL